MVRRATRRRNPSRSGDNMGQAISHESSHESPNFPDSRSHSHASHHHHHHRGHGPEHKHVMKLSQMKQRRSSTSTSLWQKWAWMDKEAEGSYSETVFNILLYVLVVGVCFGCYANSLDGDFVHDDTVAVTSNPDVTGKNPLRETFSNDFWGKPMSDPMSHKSYRPLTVLTFRLNYLFCGLSPWGYHLVNVLLHAAVCGLITYLCLEMLCWPRADCATAALLFATHPIHTEAVSNVVGRTEVLSALFFLASLLCFIRSTKPARNKSKSIVWFVCSLSLATFALLSKEQGIAVLPVCMAWRIVQLIQDKRFTQPKFSIKRGFYFLSDGIFWIILITFILLISFRLYMLQGSMPKFSDEDNPASFSPSRLTRFYTFSYLTAFNAWLLLYPNTLSYDWQMGSIPLVTSIMDIRNLATLALFVFLFSAAFSLARNVFFATTPSKKTENYILLIALAVLVVPFLPASNIFFTVGFVIAERILYVPSIGFCILVTYGLRKLRDNYKRFDCFWRFFPVLLIFMFFARTVARNHDWNSREALFRSGLKSVPHNAKVHYNFANLQKDLGNVESAVEHYKVALNLWPTHASAHNNLGTLLSSTEEAERHFRSALIINPQHPRALFNLASLYSKEGREKISQELLQKVLELDAEFTEAYSSLAALYADGGRIEEAETLHLKALNVDPENADAYNNYGTFLQRVGRVDEAVQQYKEAIRLQPNHTVAIVNAARSLRTLKNNREAEQLYKRALAINAEAKIMDNLGVLYISAGRIAEASQLYNEMREKHSDYTEGKVHFAQVLMQKRSFQHAEQVLLSVVQRNSTYRDALHQLSLLYSQINRTTEALDYILKALNFCSSDNVNCAQLHVDHGDILKDMKQWDDAVESYKMAIQLEPNLSHAHVNLAVIKHLQGDCHQALRHYHEAYVLDPDNQLLQENMRKLKVHLVDGSGICHGTQPASCRSR